MPSGGTLYAIRAEGTSFVKIGSTRKNALSRLKDLQTAQPFTLQLVATAVIEDNVRAVEKKVHRFLNEKRQRGEWFALEILDDAALAQLIIEAMQYVEVPQGPIIGGSLGQNIRKARKDYGMSQTVLAERIGISKTSLSLIESGDTKDPRYSIVRRIAQALRLRMDDLDPLGPQEVSHAGDAF